MIDDVERIPTLVDRFVMMFVGVLSASLLFGLFFVSGGSGVWFTYAYIVFALLCGAGGFVWPYRIQDFLISMWNF